MIKEVMMKDVCCHGELQASEVMVTDLSMMDLYNCMKHFIKELRFVDIVKDKKKGSSYSKSTPKCN